MPLNSFTLYHRSQILLPSVLIVLYPGRVMVEISHLYPNTYDSICSQNGLRSAMSQLINAAPYSNLNSKICPVMFIPL